MPVTLRTLVPTLSLLLAGCAETAWMVVPARVGLEEYERLGLASFRGDDPALADRFTRSFEERLLEARPEVLLVDLGAVDPTDLGALRVRAAELELDAVFVGTFEFSDVAPSVGLASSLVELRARAEILGTLNVRLLDVATGATRWSDSSDRKATIAQADLDTNLEGSAEVLDLEHTKKLLVGSLAQDVTHAFRDQYYEKYVEDIPPHYEVRYPDGVAVWGPPGW